MASSLHRKAALSKALISFLLFTNAYLVTDVIFLQTPLKHSLPIALGIGLALAGVQYVRRMKAPPPDDSAT